MISKRGGIVTTAAILLVVIWSARLLGSSYQQYPQSAWNSAKDAFAGRLGHGSQAHTEVAQHYFEQSFAGAEPALFPFDEVRAACDAADWDHNEAYLNCVGMTAGMTSIMSQVKVCFKMAIETGSHLMLPRMPLRDSHDLREFNFLNGDAYMPYDQWYDADHLRRQMRHACPRMKIVHPDDVDPETAVAKADKAGKTDKTNRAAKLIPKRRHFTILCSDAPYYQKIHSYFWVGRPYKTFFNEQFARHMERLADEEAARETPVVDNGGITVVDVDSEFLLFRITDDPTRRDLRLWTELSHLIRFRADVRTAIDRLVTRLPAGGNYMGVHFRAENDSIWSSPEHQLGVDLDALDRAWAQVGQPGEPKPPVYLACGDPGQIAMFARAAADRGWTTTNKYALAAADAAGAADVDTPALINGMAFDFQGAIDLGIMVTSRFFLGVQGSAFSSTVGNHRDVTGRYRGSSFELPDDGAATHLFNDLDATEYACCL